MWALIGLLVGAFLGHALWRDWGAALGGIAGFLICAKISQSRAKAPKAATRGPIAFGAAKAAATLHTTPALGPDRNLPARIEALERRVALLEEAIVRGPGGTQSSAAATIARTGVPPETNGAASAR